MESQKVKQSKSRLIDIENKSDCQNGAGGEVNEMDEED